MPRPIDDLQPAADLRVEREREPSISHRTQRAFVAAVAVLLLGTLIASRTSTAIVEPPPARPTTGSVGTPLDSD